MTPVTPYADAPLQSPQPITPGQSGLTAEQRLIDYIVRFQAQGLTSGQQLGNPAALSGEALKALKGYLERAAGLQDKISGKGRAMSEPSEGANSTVDAQLAGLPAGPAHTPLELAATRLESVGEKPAGVSLDELQRIMDFMFEIAQYNTETTMITSATNNISKSVTSLIHAQ
jgi:hypothetical protein